MSYYNYDYVTPQSFVREAKKLAARTEESAEFVPFNPYWFQTPGYHTLNARQLSWYFYWRTQIRNGHYLPSDLGYIFLHVNEVVNLVGFNRPMDAYERLVALWKHYRAIKMPVIRCPTFVWDYKQSVVVPIHPIDGYLVNWIADFIRVHKLPIHLMDWYTLAVTEGAILTDVHLMVAAWLQSRKPLTEMPIDAVFALANYYPSRNRFYEDYHKSLNLDDIYRKGIAAVGQFIVQKHKGKKSLLAQTNRSYSIKRRPFERTLYLGTQSLIPIIELPARVNYRKISNDFTNIIKYTENIFREQVRFRAKVRGAEIDADWKRVIAAAFEADLKPIEIDYRRVFEISTKSDAVRDRLIVAMEDEVDEASPLTDTFNGEFMVSAETSDAAFTSDPQSMNPQQLGVLAAFRDQQWQISQNLLQAIITDQFVNVVIDQINDWAFDAFGDVLIIESDTGYRLVEDFRPEITALLDEHI